MCGIVTCFTTSHHVIVSFLESPARRGGHRLRHIVNHVVCGSGTCTTICHRTWCTWTCTATICGFSIFTYQDFLNHTHTTLVGMIISIMRACHMYYMSYGNHVTKSMSMTLCDRRSLSLCIQCHDNHSVRTFNNYLTYPFRNDCVLPGECQSRSQPARSSACP